MHNQTKTVLALLMLTTLAAIAFAQYGPGQALPSAFDVILQINDARGAYGTGYDLCAPWNKSLVNYPPYKFAAGKNFTLIIRETASSPKYPSQFQDYRVSAVANDTGFVRFNINIPGGVDVTKKTNWYVAIVVEWPRPGTYFLVFNQTFTGASLLDIIGYLSGRPDLKTVVTENITIAPSRTTTIALKNQPVSVIKQNNTYIEIKADTYGYPLVELQINGTTKVTAGVITLKVNAPKGSVQYNSATQTITVNSGNGNATITYIATYTFTGPWGVLKVTNGAGRFGNLSSSVIHTFYIGVNTLGKQFTLTFTRTVTIAGTTITLDDNVAPATGPTNYLLQYDPLVTAVFGPFTYLATYVTSFGTAGKADLKIDPTQVAYNHYIYITIEGSRGVVIQSKNDAFTTAGRLRHVAQTLNKTAGRGTGVNVPMSCGLIIWNMTMYTVKITGLLDLKGNPIFNPENFRYKIQLKVGDSWVTLDRAQASWRLTLGDVKAVLNQVCGTISTASDIMNCYRNLGPDGFRRAVLSLYEPVTLSRLGGLLQLTNTDVKVSTVDLTTKLVVEYSYTAVQDTVKAIVFEAPLAEPANFEVVLPVSVLPIQIRLWRWSNYSLPPAVPTPREYFYTDPLDLASLRFEVSGDTMYINRMAYDAP
ncbi:hypothetical protein [Pyrobaculum aerophilum]|uniref:Uncharacterized protein n=1 Tax=Pyrobaculum aerophilum TaxID=13773 RepID=A0A371R3M9_9CREN|nr:hypothetical protein [Pyrobaculum aerophilum]RFA98383.1 hypothetical protein CGL52_07510 [Pyrobaculum aerophilum]